MKDLNKPIPERDPPTSTIIPSNDNAGTKMATEMKEDRDEDAWDESSTTRTAIS